LNALCQRRIFAASSPHNTISSALTMGGVRVQRTNKQIALVTEMVTDCG
jgi:hypothetical protein